ncbi:hypothetical protein [Microbulbifer sp. SAOS-129_SWC]|uniref:hypothetical protein n=1 Tax=Microbulbifer sp. SAOS-129_SWC TaxID=3145235 RepID=UPI0032162CA2
MTINSQISNWLVSALGGLATWAVIAACILLALNVFYRARLLRNRGDSLHWLLDRTLVIRFLCLLFFIWVLLGFNSNAPKLVLVPDDAAERTAEQQLLRAEAAPVQSIAPQRDSAAETSARLQQLREAQKEAVLPGSEP